MKKSKKIRVKSFKCDDLTKYVDSILFDSGTEIAKAIFTCNGETLEVSLQVFGDVSVPYKGKVYHKPSEFPEELFELMKNNKFNTGIKKYYINWFEFLINGEFEDWEFEEYLPEAKPYWILDSMISIARNYFKVESEEKRLEILNRCKKYWERNNSNRIVRCLTQRRVCQF